MNRTLLACLLAAPMLATTLHAQPFTVWNSPGAGTALWSDSANWVVGGVPTSADKAILYQASQNTAVIDSPAVAYQLVVAQNGGSGAVSIHSGGSLTTGNEWSAIGYDGVGSLEVQTGGSATFGAYLLTGFVSGGVGTLTLNGGNVTVGTLGNPSLLLGWGGGVGYANINAGTLTLNGWNGIQGSSIMNIEAGQVIFPDIDAGNINNWISTGRITGYGGGGTVVQTPGAGIITLTAVLVPEPGTLGLLSLGLLGVVAARRARRHMA